MREQNFWFRSKQQRSIEDAPVKRLLAKSIARDEQATFPIIPKREREHAIEMLDHITAIFFVKMRQDFRVRFAAKGVAASFQIRSQFAVVIDLAVENYRDAVIFIECRLLARQQIDDRQTPHSQRDAIIDQITFRIGPAMGEATDARCSRIDSCFWNDEIESAGRLSLRP